MKKPWSITTTTRSPYRLRSQLQVLKGEFSGREWDRGQQINFQISLIQHRLYGNTEEEGFSKQFLRGMRQDLMELFTDVNHKLTFDEAESIFNEKNYKDPSMRGRQSFNPFKKFGFVAIRDRRLEITALGEYFLSNEYNLSELFLRIFLKWQIPNPDNDDYSGEEGDDIKPFVGTLHLIQKVNEKMGEAGEKAKGISKQEFGLFAPTLVNYGDIERYSEEITRLRKMMAGKNKIEQKNIFKDYARQFIKNFLATEDETRIKKCLKNLKDYGDNAIRYFRLTNYLHIRGGGFYVDLEKRRHIEIGELLNHDSGKSLSFEDRGAYLDYVSDINKPELPWETKETLIEILKEVESDARLREKELSRSEKTFEDFDKLNLIQLKALIEEIRSYRRDLQEQHNHSLSQDTGKVAEYIDILKNIRKADDRPLTLEKYSALALHALNDAIKIQPNYPVGDDNEPTFTAPAGKPDIECFYKGFNAICEVTMLEGRGQWVNEGQPIMRHLRDFEKEHTDKDTYCLFVAPSLHRDTLNTFWNSVKYEYEGEKQRIIPLSITSFIELLDVLLQLKSRNKAFKHTDLTNLYEEIIAASQTSPSVIEWQNKIPAIMTDWRKTLLS